MRKILLSTITCLLPILTFAQNATNDDSGYFASIVAGPTRSAGHNLSGTTLPSKADTYVISGGYFFNKNFAMSAGYRGAASEQYVYSNNASAHTNGSAFSLVFNAYGIYPVSQNFSLTGGVALMYQNSSQSATVTNGSTTTYFESGKVGTLPFFTLGGMLQLDKSLYLTGNYAQSVKYDNSGSNNYGITTSAILVGVLKKF
jgi:hypothetical protein